MKLKYKVAKLEDVDEKYRDLYEARDGAYYLAAEGATDKSKVDEFRDNNTELKRQLEAALGKVPTAEQLEEYKQLKAEADKLKTKKMIEAGKVDELVEEKVKAMRADLEGQIATLAKQRDTLNSQLETLLIDNGLQSAAVAAGVEEHAMEDVLLRGRGVFKVKDGKAIPHDKDGKIIYGKDGSTPQAMSEWLAGLSSTAKHLFKQSSGGGAQNNVKGVPPGTRTMPRAQYDQLSPEARHAFVTKEKGVVVDQ